MKDILIAGGSGTIGRKLCQSLTEKGHRVRVLTRTPRNEDDIFWDPMQKQIDRSVIGSTQVIINLSGAGIADAKWTPARKLELQQSRVGTNLFFAELVEDLPLLEQFICASGINAYGFRDPEKEYVETDEYGTDFLSQLVKVWELSAMKLSDHCKVSLVRTAVVWSPSGGALERMVPPIKKGIGSALGSGKQAMPWIHIDDLVSIYTHIIDNQLEGSFNALAGVDTNGQVMKTIAKVLHKPYWFPNVPAFALRLLFGEMALMLLNGVKASNAKIKSSGFSFNHPTLSEALQDVLKSHTK
jgi:uncharacterized protein (TIGR01777 family)